MRLSRDERTTQTRSCQIRGEVANHRLKTQVNNELFFFCFLYHYSFVLFVVCSTFAQVVDVLGSSA